MDGRRGRTTALLLLLVGVVGACGGSGDGSEAPALAPAPLRLATLEMLRGPWSPVPFDVDRGLLARLDQACRTSMQPFPPGVSLVVFDARGGGGVQMQYAGPDGSEASCFDVRTEADGTVQAMGGGSTGTSDAPIPALGPRQIEGRGSSSSGDGVQTTSSATSCRAGAGIAVVMVEMPGQPPMRASLANGWCMASFPGAWPAGSKLVGLDLNGEVVATAGL